MVSQDFSGMMARTTRRMALAGIAGLAILGAASLPAKADTITLRAGSGHPPVLPYVDQFKAYFIPEFTKRVKEATGDDVKFIEAYGGSVAKLPEVFDAVEKGLLDIGLQSTPFEPVNLFLANYAYKAPFGTPDPVRAGQIAREIYNAIPEMNTSVEGKGIQVLAVLAASNYNIITTAPWKTLKDLEGRKIQAAGPNLPWLRPANAVPVQGGLGQAYNNMQTGVSEGMLIHYQGMMGFKLYEPAKYIAQIDFGALPINMLLMNKKRYDSLPAEVQKILHEVSLVYEEKVNKANADRDKDAIDKMVAAGATLLKIDDSVKAEWAKGVAFLPKEAADEGSGMGLPMKAVLQKYIDISKKDGFAAMDAYNLN
ncbi:MAG: C4-dicarboxylate TRAP transporter substrate-binding protein [Hyphomicrobiales bacterium]|nr:C4-dicarboxylate TRAP transporter substrate-binding protein [Hyphomicrobiales bacterium]